MPTKSDPFGAANTATLLMPTGVALFGGFAGSEHSLAARNITNNVTAITGEIATSSINDNLMRIVTCADVLDLDLDGDNDTSEALSLDIDGATRVRGSSVDMGAHEAP